MKCVHGKQIFGEGWEPCNQCPPAIPFARDPAVDLLRRIRQWDMLDSCADGAYWKREIDAVLDRRQQSGKDALEDSIAILDAQALRVTGTKTTEPMSDQ